MLALKESLSPKEAQNTQRTPNSSQSCSPAKRNGEYFNVLLWGLPIFQTGLQIFLMLEVLHSIRDYKFSNPSANTRHIVRHPFCKEILFRLKRVFCLIFSYPTPVCLSVMSSRISRHYHDDSIILLLL